MSKPMLALLVVIILLGIGYYLHKYYPINEKAVPYYMIYWTK